MRSFLATIIVSQVLGLGLARAHGDSHPAPKTPPVTTDSVCSKFDKDVCAHVHFLTEVNSSEEAEFIFHVENDADIEVSHLVLDLWMEMGDGHGHSSAPVEVELSSFNHFKVKNAWFVMPGQWYIRSSFILGGVYYQLNIPVSVKE